MKSTFLFILIYISLMSVSKAQIFATTTTGKKVILNIDGTWKYASGNEDVKPCEKNKIGYLLVTNNTSADIYFYYSTYGNVLFKKVKAGSNIKINVDSVSKYSYDNTTKEHEWTVLYEPYQFTINDRIGHINGFERGKVKVETCDTEEITIEE